MIAPEWAPVSEFFHDIDPHRLQLSLCLLATIAVALKYVLQRQGKPTWTITVALVLLAALTFVGTMHSQMDRFWTKRSWSTFHYFLGSKYFDELGYRGLYRFTLLADEETGVLDTKPIRRIRNLDDYSHESREQALRVARAELDETFTDERWEEFKQDWTAMSQFGGWKKWNRILNDHGFNPPPVWNTIPGTVAQHVMVGDEMKFLIVRHADLFFLLIALIVCGILCGSDAPLLMFIFFGTAFYNEGHLIATYFGFFHLAALIIAMSLYRSERWKTSAGFLAVSTMWRIFPLFFFAGPLVAWIRDTVKSWRRGERRLPRKWTGFVATFAIACTIFGLIGLPQGEGPKSTRDFLSNIGMHAEFIRFDGNKFGIRLAVTDTPLRSKSSFTSRKAIWEDHLVRNRALQVLFIALALVAMWRGKDDDAWTIPMGMLLIFAIMTLSRYYYLVLLIWFIPGRKLARTGFAAWAAGALLVCNAVFHLAAVLGAGGRGIFCAGTEAFFVAFLSFPIFLLVQEWFDKRRERQLAADLQGPATETEISAITETETETERSGDPAEPDPEGAPA